MQLMSVFQASYNGLTVLRSYALTVLHSYFSFSGNCLGIFPPPFYAKHSASVYNSECFTCHFCISFLKEIMAMYQTDSDPKWGWYKRKRLPNIGADSSNCPEATKHWHIKLQSFILLKKRVNSFKVFTALSYSSVIQVQIDPAGSSPLLGRLRHTLPIRTKIVCMICLVALVLKYYDAVCHWWDSPSNKHH
jgi:hypothetical protein